MKKRMAGLLCALTLLLSTPALASAGGAVYDLDELDMSITIPSGLIVFTRDTPADDPGYGRMNITKEQMDALLQESGLYLSAIAADHTRELTIAAQETSLPDFNTLSDLTLLAELAPIEDDLLPPGHALIGSSVYPHHSSRFLVLSALVLEKDESALCFRAVTVLNGRLLQLTLRLYDDVPYSEAQAVLEGMIGSIVFHAAEEPGSGACFFPETGVGFTLPEGWSEAPLLPASEAAAAQLIHTQIPGLTISYSYSDLWADQDEYTKERTNREAFDRKVGPISDYLAAYAPVEDCVISSAVYGGREYGLLEMELTSSLSYDSAPVPITEAVYIQDGVMHLFVFSGVHTDGYFQDFEALLDSVSYPVPSYIAFPSPDAPDDSYHYEVRDAAATSAAISSAFSSPAVVLLFTLLGVLLILVIFHLCRPFAKGGSSAASSSAAEDPWLREDVTPSVPEDSSKRPHCCRCGALLPYGSSFCHCCGAPVDRKDGVR